MLKFKMWFLKEDSRSLAATYSDLLKNVPQDQVHHPEGDVLTHVKLVRKAIPKAINRLNSLKSVHPFSEILEDMNFDTSPEELSILYLCAWLHDIGKATATKIGGINYSFLSQMDLSYQNDPSKISASKHDSSLHYSPLIKSLEEFAPESTKALYLKNKDVVDFVTDHHMQLGRFPKSFIKEHFKDGKAVNSQKLKLLFILMWADKMGRTPEAVATAIGENERGLIDSSKESIKIRMNQEKTASRSKSFDSPESMAKQLSGNNVSKEQIKRAIKGKFPDIGDDDLLSILRSI